MAIMLIANDIAIAITKGYMVLEFRSEVELDVLEILLSHAEHITRVGEEYIATLDIFCHVLILTLLELVEFCLVVALHPACLVKMNRLPAALRVILVLETILDNLKLELTHSTDDLTTVKLIDEQLRHTLVHKLIDALLQLLCLHRVIVLDVLEHLRRERRQSAEMELLAVCQRIANLEDAVIGQTDDVARPCLLNGALALRHELRRRREADGLALTYVEVRLVALELAAAHLAEGNT